jgi:macrolide-specific efflux system membrane fusion protein
MLDPPSVASAAMPAAPSAVRPPLRRAAWTGAILFGGLLVAAAVVLFGGRGADRERDAPRSAAVERGTLALTVTALGKLGPKSFVDVGAQVSGQLDALHVAVGDRVEQGQLLAEIDPRLLESRVEADRARVASLQAQAAERAAALELARAQHARNTTLQARGLVARDLLETRAAALKQAQAQQRSLQAQLREAQSTLGGNEASLGYARIYAPMAGTVVSLAVLEGQTLNANQVAPVLMRVADLQQMTVTAQVAEADIGRIQVGMPAWFSTLGQPDRRWRGTVRQLLPTPDIVNEVVLYRALIDVENADGALLPDMTAQVFFELERAEDVLLVPVAALQAGRGRERSTAVRVLGRDGTIETRPVQIGLRDREQAQVLEGLREGERVLLPDAAPDERERRRGGFGLFGGGRRG